MLSIMIRDLYDGSLFSICLCVWWLFSLFISISNSSSISNSLLYIINHKTIKLNDQGASFGPFSQQVVILNTDGSTFTLLQNPQAMRLKKAGYIEDRKFVIQPSQQVIDDALEGGESLGDALKGIFGGKEEEAIPVSNEVVLEEKSVDVVATDSEESVVVEESSSAAAE